jgi:hypothetical protein
MGALGSSRVGRRAWWLLCGKITEEWGQPVAPGIYVDLLTLGQSFPGGAIDFENGDLVLKENAV